MDLLTYYTQQSPITDPKAYAALLAELPRNLVGLCRVVQGLLFHYFANEKILHYSIPNERLPEADTRDVAMMLWWFIRSRLLHDMAAQNKTELLLWDVWDLTEEKLTQSAMPLLEKLALLTQGGDQAFAELQAPCEQEPGL
jgi:hypothetical protein